jgi:uncharacterized protein
LIQLTHFAGFLLASLISGAPIFDIMTSEFKNHLSILGHGLGVLIFGLPLAYMVTKYLWRRDYQWVGLIFSVKQLLGGIMVGLILPVFVVWITSAFIEVNFVLKPDRFGLEEIISILIGSFCLMIFVALAEELVFRGMAAREWAVKYGWMVAIILGGLYFGAIHLLPMISKISLQDSLRIMLAALAVSFLLTALYIRGRSLWLPLGLHVGWNFSLMTIIGATISGKEAAYGLYRTELVGADIFTGGEFGVEASIISIAVYLIVGVLFLTLSKRGLPELLKSGFPDEE